MWSTGLVDGLDLLVSSPTGYLDIPIVATTQYLREPYVIALNYRTFRRRYAETNSLKITIARIASRIVNTACH